MVNRKDQFSATWLPVVRRRPVEIGRVPCPCGVMGTSRSFEYPYSIDTNLVGLVLELLTKRELLRSLQPILSRAVAPSPALGLEHEFASIRSTQTMRGGPSNLSYCALTAA
jgi:hypothetical protein